MMNNLAVTSLLIAAKLEQPISPSFDKMINDLEDYGIETTKKNLKYHER